MKRNSKQEPTTARLEALVARKTAALERQQASLDQLRRRLSERQAYQSLTPEQRSYQEMAERLRELCRKHIPSRATCVVVTNGDADLLKFSRKAWHFPRTQQGEHIQQPPACGLAAIVHLEACRAAGAEFFVLPQGYHWWETNHPALFQRLNQHFRVVAQAPDAGTIWSLKLAPKASRKDLAAQFAASVAADFRAAVGRNPAVLDWNSGPPWDRMLPDCAVFQPHGFGALPYLDKSVDIVVTSTADAVALGEAHRVASAAVVRLDADASKLSVAWIPGFKQQTGASVSIVIPCYNRAAMTEACLRSLFETLPTNTRGEVIVVDDCSTDSTPAMLRRLAKLEKRLKWFRNKRNLRFVDSCNFAAAQAKGETLIFLNNDLVMLPGWLEPMLQVFRNHADAGVCGGKLIFPDGTLQEAGGVVFRDGSAMNYGRGDADLTAPQYSFLREVDYCSGALFATRRELFQKLGGFGTEYRPGYYEDTDYCFKVREAGLKVYFQPESAVIHLEGGTAGTDTAKGMKRYQVVNQGKFRARWAEALKSQPENPGWSNSAGLRALAWRNPRRVLVASYYPPEFDRDSGSKRILDLIELLIAEGFSVTFLAQRHAPSARYNSVLQQMGVAIFDGRVTKTEELLAMMKFDLAMLAYWPVAETYLPALRKMSPQTRVIVDSVDLHFLRVARGVFRAVADGNSTGLLGGSFGSDTVRELNTYAAADAVLTVSQKEASLVNDFLSRPAFARVVADLEPSASGAPALSERRGVVFMGSFRHTPNVGAVEFLCKEVVPHISPALTAKHPIYIIGEGLTDEIRSFADGLPQVRMVGWVPEVLPYLEAARVSVIPLRYGAGTKRKLLQALMAGTPAVSTSVGIEGFGLTDGENVLVADDGKLLARAVEALITDGALWNRLSTNGREHMLATHGREVVRQQLRDAISSMPALPATSEASAEKAASTPVRVDKRQYAEIVSDIRRLVGQQLPPDAKVVVVSKGDDGLLSLDGRAGMHFPQDKDGVYAGYYPENGEDAIKQLEAVRKRGGQFFLLPSTALWWLDHYKELAEHLKAHYTESFREEATCVIFDLRVKRRLPPAKRIVTGISDVRLIAFYLPQFHPIPENDAWWGEGFTEWTNVGRAKPAFEGHYQPRLPADLGFYDLRLPETRTAQAELARAHGIHGFCYYHYWFGGKRLLERPFNEVFASGEPDFPFCLCWANEPWSRRWNGRAEDVLQPQTYSPEDDVTHIRWLLPVLKDSRAIKIDGRPVFVVYQGRDLPDPARTVTTWRREVAAAGLPGIYLLTVETGWDAGWDATQVGFDGKILFAPQFTTLFNSGAEIKIPGKDKLRVFDYEKAWRALANPAPVKYLRYESVCPSWDNSARRGDEAVVLHNCNAAAYEQWLREAVARASSRPKSQRVVFLNAWNEWAEGAHLEPDLKNGLAYLEATKRALTIERKVQS